MNPLKILFLDILTDDPKIRKEDDEMLATYDGYGGLIRRCLKEEQKFHTVDAGSCDLQHLVSIEDRVREWDGIIVGGSVTNIGNEENKPWQTRVLWIIEKAIKAQVPVLGICGGHQYGAVAIRGFNKTVIKNPFGPNRGTSSLILNENGKAHPLFKGLSNEPAFQWSHSFIVMELPAGAVVLASHPKTRNAVFQYGSFIGMQFHPEFGALKESDYGIKVMNNLIDMKIRESSSESERHELEMVLCHDIRSAPDSPKIFRNWVEMIRTGFFK